MNKEHREKAAKSFAAYGQEFAPTLVQEDDNFFIMDWRDKNGSGNMATRYILDKKKGTLIITGDSGNCIATWHSRKKPEEIARYLNDEQYFIEKMQCTEYKYDYDWDDVLADLKELREEYLDYVRKGGFCDNDSHEITEEECMEDFHKMEMLLDEIHIDEHTRWPDDLIELFEKYNTDWWESSFSDLGRRVSFRIYQWIYGFQMGLEILKNKDEEEKTREVSVLQLYEIAGIRTVEIRKIRKALKQKTCDDCISRAEAIKETKALIRGNYDPEYIIETLKMLPPVTPKAEQKNEILFSKDICSSAWWKTQPEYGAAFIEKPLDEGLSVEEISNIYEKLSGTSAVPVEIQGDHSSAMGFINLTDAEYMNYDYTALEETVRNILNDMDKENKDNTYECPNNHGVTTIWLSR